MPRSPQPRTVRLSLEPLEARYALNADLTPAIGSADESILAVETSGDETVTNEAVWETFSKEGALGDLGVLDGADEGLLYGDLTDPIFFEEVADSFRGDPARFDALQSAAEAVVSATGTSSIQSVIGVEATLTLDVEPLLFPLPIGLDPALGLSIAQSLVPASFADSTPAKPDEPQPQPREWRAESASIRKPPLFHTPAFAHHGSPALVEGDDFGADESESEDVAADDAPADDPE